MLRHYRWLKSVIEPNSQKGYSLNSVKYGSNLATVYHVTESRSISVPSTSLCSTSYTVIREEAGWVLALKPGVCISNKK